MSTGENINANGMVLSGDMVRGGFNKFPQTILVRINPTYYVEIAPIQIASAYPFTVQTTANVPPGELWYIGVQNELLGRIINIGLPT